MCVRELELVMVTVRLELQSSSDLIRNKRSGTHCVMNVGFIQLTSENIGHNGHV